MPIPIHQAVDEAGATAAGKAKAVRDLPRYLAAAALAGAFVGIAVVLMFSVAGPLVAASSPFAKLVQGAVFGIALTLVVFAGAELFTGNAMTMLQGLKERTVTPFAVLAVWVASLVGNLLGSVALAALVHAGGTFSGNPSDKMLGASISAKNLATGPQLFWRSVLCNMLVCLGLWMAARATSDSAKAIVLWWALLAFIGSGFEHSIANMTIFGIGIFEGTASWADLGRNLAWTVPGNLVGGGVIVGLGYAWLGHSGSIGAARTQSTGTTIAEPPPTVRPGVQVPAGAAGAVATR
jgi:nitrite transporter NirC